MKKLIIDGDIVYVSEDSLIGKSLIAYANANSKQPQIQEVVASSAENIYAFDFLFNTDKEELSKADKNSVSAYNNASNSYYIRANGQDKPYNDSMCSLPSINLK